MSTKVAGHDCHVSITPTTAPTYTGSVAHPKKKFRRRLNRARFSSTEGEGGFSSIKAAENPLQRFFALRLVTGAGRACLGS